MFEPMAPFSSGFKADGDVKKLGLIKLANNKGNGVIVVQNNGPLKLSEVR